MHFCIKCDNMYYLKLKEIDGQTLVYYCRHCGHEADDISKSDICVLKTQVNRTEEKYSHIINEFTKEDQTLPRINTISCPMQECPSNKGDIDKEVLYIRYDDANMRYVYMCTRCDTTWKTSEHK